MSKRIEFWGSGDDLVEVDGDLGRDEFQCYDIIVFHLRSELADERLAVIATYAPDGAAMWCIGIGQIDEDDLLPAWPFRFFRKHNYSIGLEIEVPDDTILTPPFETTGSDET